MAYREHGMWEVLDVLRRLHRQESIRQVSRVTGRSRGTVRRWVNAARQLGWRREDAPSEELATRVVAAAQPGPEEVRGETEQLLTAYRERIGAWLRVHERGERGLTLTKVRTLLAREGIVVPYSSLHRFAVRELGFGRHAGTVRRAEVVPGELAEVDFGKLGLIFDPEAGRRRTAWALVVSLGYSRHMYVHLTFSQQVRDLIAGIEAAWRFFRGVARRVVLDNLKAAVVKPDRYDPTFQRTFDEYAAHRGFVIDAAIVRHPTGKPIVERGVPYVRESFYRGETFVSLAEGQARAEGWCRTTAGMRVHGTTRAQPLVVFEQVEQAALLAFDGLPFDVPSWAEVKVHPDCHVRVGYALYSVPFRYRGQRVTVRADQALVRIYVRGALVKTHPVARPGGRQTDYGDYPAEQTPYAMRDAASVIRRAAGHGASIGRFAERLLEGTFPWAKLRQAQKLLRLVDKYGAKRVEGACVRALLFDMVNVFRLESMIMQALAAAPAGERQQVASEGVLRFLRPGTSLTHPSAGTE
jgi:transposase